MKIEFEIPDNDYKAIIESAFPEKKTPAEIQETTNKIAEMISKEFLDLLGGKKRYLSLSHQYIEWVQEVYRLVLPDADIKYDKLLNHFNFPSGQAAYIARVLNDRKNTPQQSQAKKNLIQKLELTCKEFNELQPENRGGQEKRTLKLTIREYKILDNTIGKLNMSGEDMSTILRLESYTNEGYKISYLIEDINKVLKELKGV